MCTWFYGYKHFTTIKDFVNLGEIRGKFHGDYGTARRTPTAVVVELTNFEFKGTSDPTYFEINVGKRRIRHRTTLNLNDAIFSRF